MQVYRSLLLILLVVLPGVVSVQRASAQILDPDSQPHPMLMALSEKLAAAGIDVAYNLNVPAVAETNPHRPRLGALADLPPGRLPLTPELLAWESAFLRNELGALAFFPTTAPAASGLSSEEFQDSWLRTPAQQRFFISFHRDDTAIAQALWTVLQEAQMSAQLLPPLTVTTGTGTHSALLAETGGRMYAIAGQRWVIDSLQARADSSEVTEFRYLGEVLQDNSHSVIDPDSRAARRISSGEPAVFLKESLGDEFEASTIPEIVVPGGIAFGESAVFGFSAASVVFEAGRLWLLDTEGRRYSLPQETAGSWKAQFDFAARSERIRSDAIVDIDERGRVRLSAELLDTDIGADMIRLDTEPFNFVQSLDVRKSVIIDTSVRFEPAGTVLEFETEYEVRFLQADRLRIAQTEAALVYDYSSASAQSVYGQSWGPQASQLEGRTDFEGLGHSTVNAARYAAWIALFRSVLGNELDFSLGRYEFMKIDKAGRATPSRL